jgi:hypothetical protein
LYASPLIINIMFIYIYVHTDEETSYKDFLYQRSTMNNQLTAHIWFFLNISYKRTNFNQITYSDI